jgi:hypothetical protein
MAGLQKRTHRRIMPQPDEYLAIRAWGEMMRSAPSYIVADQQLAADSNAPIDSIYHGSREWVRISEITNPDARRRIEDGLNGLRRELNR